MSTRDQRYAHKIRNLPRSLFTLVACFLAMRPSNQNNKLGHMHAQPNIHTVYCLLSIRTLNALKKMKASELSNLNRAPSPSKTAHNFFMHTMSKTKPRCWLFFRSHTVDGNPGNSFLLREESIAFRLLINTTKGDVSNLELLGI